MNALERIFKQPQKSLADLFAEYEAFLNQKNYRLATAKYREYNEKMRLINGRN